VGVTSDSRKVRPRPSGSLAVPCHQAYGLSFCTKLRCRRCVDRWEGAPPALPPCGMFVKSDARRALALLASRVLSAAAGSDRRCHRHQRKLFLLAAFTRQIWASLGYEAASVGTIGIVTNKREVLRLAHDSHLDLHRTLSDSPWRVSLICPLTRRRTARSLVRDGVRVAAFGSQLTGVSSDYHREVDAFSRPSWVVPNPW